MLAGGPSEPTPSDNWFPCRKRFQFSTPFQGSPGGYYWHNPPGQLPPVYQPPSSM